MALQLSRVRILCFNEEGSLLLMKWQDPIDGHVFWEPPGGGIEPGESPLQAAVRELYEETGFQAQLDDNPLHVERQYRFAGRDHHHLEAFYITSVSGQCDAAAFTEEELVTFLEWRFVTPKSISELDSPIEPPTLADVLQALPLRQDGSSWIAA